MKGLQALGKAKRHKPLGHPDLLGVGRPHEPHHDPRRREPLRGRAFSTGENRKPARTPASTPHAVAKAADIPSVYPTRSGTSNNAVKNGHARFRAPTNAMIGRATSASHGMNGSQPS